MQTSFFRLDSYLLAGESYHFARKTLASGPPSPMHRHEFFELFLIEAGSTRHLINGRSEKIGPGSLCFIRPDDTHAFHTDSAAPCRIFNVMFPAETADHLARRYGGELGQRFFWKTGDAPDLLHLQGTQMERAVAALVDLSRCRRSLSIVEQFLLNLMTRVIDQSDPLPEAAPGWLTNACIAARSPDVFRAGVPGFVRAAGRGHEHVCRMTRKYLGVSPTTYLTRIRIEHAAQLLSGSDLPIPDIAADCGMENLSHFYRTFRAIYGTTPRHYRKSNRVDPIQPVFAAGV